MEIELKEGIHEVKKDNLIPFIEGRKKYLKEAFNICINNSEHMIIIGISKENPSLMFTSLELKELVYYLENSKQCVFHKLLNVCTSR